MGHHLQQPVAHVVPQAVVDPLEPVQVEKADLESPPVARGFADGVLNAVGQQGPVRQARQGVVGSLVLQAGFELAARGDVAQNYLHRGHAAQADAQAAGRDEQSRSIQPQGLFVRVERVAPLGQGIQRGGNAVLIPGSDQ